jgi:hypothetical protein
MKIRIFKRGTDYRARYLVQRKCFIFFWRTLKLFYSGSTVSFYTTKFRHLADAEKALDGYLNNKRLKKVSKKDRRIKEIVMKASYK